MLGFARSGKGGVFVFGDANCLDSSHMVRPRAAPRPRRGRAARALRAPAPLLPAAAAALDARATTLAALPDPDSSP